MPTIDEQVSVIVVTALPIEQAAVKQILDRVEEELDGFIFGTVEFRGVALHRLAVGVLPQAGNSAAAAEASRWVARFPNARYIVMVGIAGGVPAPDDPERHVRLGDVVVSDAVGVREHDRGKVKEGVFEPMPGGGATPSAQFVSICRSLIGSSLIGEYAWKEVLDSRFSADVWSRPDESTDLLTPIGDPPAAVLHPDPDMYRAPGVPRLSSGLIASGNVVVKDADRRAVLAGIGAVAVEMEGAGLATSAWVSEREHFVVRGIVDYADGGKNNLWHRYGAAAAAAVFRSILERKSATIAEAPDTASPGILDGAQAGYVADISAGVASAVVAAEASRVPVVGVVRRWQDAHEAANRRTGKLDPSTGESLTTFISPQQAQTFVGEAITALNEAVESVRAYTLPTLTALDLLSDVTDSDNVRDWLDQLRRDLEQMCDTAGHWPAAPSRNRLEPPPADDDGDLSAAIVAVRTSLVSLLKCLAGEHVPAPPPPPEPIRDEPSEVQKRVQYLVELSEQLAPYGRVKSKPFNADDHNAAVEAAVELVDQTGIGLVANGLAVFPDIAASVARNATVEQWALIVEDGGRLEPLILAVQLLKAYHDVLVEAGNLGLAATAIDLATQRLSTLPEMLAADEFWESTTPDNVGRLLRYWSSADEHNDPRDLLGQRAARSKIDLCRVLDALASTMRGRDPMTGEVKLVREIRNFFRNVNDLVDPSEIRRSIETYLPEAKSFDRWTVPDGDDCLRLAVQFNAETPA